METQTQTQTQVQKIKILLIDCDEMMRIYFRDIFWLHGLSNTYEVMLASSFEEAEKIINDVDTRPDTIFLDILMPCSGKDNSTNEQIKRTSLFIEKVKKNQDLSSTKIVIFSNQKEESTKEEFEKLGVDGYLLKGELMPKEIIDFTDKIHEHH